MSEITLHVNGVTLNGWTRVRVSASLEAVARTFVFEHATAEEFKLASGWIRPNTPAVVKIDGEPVVTGYAIKPDYSYDKSSTVFSVEGASKTIDLVESDITTKPNRWTNATIRQICLGLITPHGIDLNTWPGVNDNQRVPRFKVAQGTKVHSALDDLVDDYGILLTDDEQGRLVLMRVSEEAPPPESFSAIVEGDGGNVLTGRFTADGSGLHSDYICKGQRSGSDDDFGEGIALISASVTNSLVERWRPLLIRPERRITKARALDLARWRAANAAGQAASGVYSVGGWRQGDGSLWKPGLLVPVFDERVGLDTQLLVVDCDYIESPEQGEVTQMRLVPPAAYVALGPDERKRTRKRGGLRTGMQVWADIEDSIVAGDLLLSGASGLLEGP